MKFKENSIFECEVFDACENYVPPEAHHTPLQIVLITILSSVNHKQNTMKKSISSRKLIWYEAIYRTFLEAYIDVNLAFGAFCLEVYSLIENYVPAMTSCRCQYPPWYNTD